MLLAIAAIDSKRGLADETGIPWDLPGDKQQFYAHIADGAVLMGSGTYSLFPRPLNAHPNYVVTSQAEPLKPGFIAVRDALLFAQEHQAELVYNIGGAALYEELLPVTDELILTQISGDFNCTKFFPKYEHDFDRVDESPVFTQNGIDFRVETWHRNSLPQSYLT